MKKFLTLSIAAAAVVMSFSAFQCSSTELTSAKLYIQQKNFDKAMDALNKEIQKNPQSDEGYQLLGYLYGEKGEFDKMLDCYKKSLAVSNKFEKNIKDSKKYYWGGNFNKGVAFFNRANKAQNQDSSAAYMTKAVTAFNEAIMIEPDSSDTYKNLAFALLQTNKTDEAIAPLEKLIALKKSLDAYRFLGQIYYQKGSLAQSEYKSSKNAQDSLKANDYFDKAIGVLEAGRKTYPDDSDILLYLSNTYVAANKIDVAIDAFKTGVEKEPSNKFYRYNYGVLLLGSNKFSEAAEQFTKAVEIDPQYHNALYNLGVTYVKWGTIIRDLAEKEQKDDPEVKVKYNLAIPHFQKALEIKPDDPGTWELVGKVYATLGMTKESKEAFDKADQYRK